MGIRVRALAGVAAAAIGTGLVVGSVMNSVQAPQVSAAQQCEEDMPCWRVWMGNGTYGPNTPAYMFLPEGPQWDAQAHLFGYVNEYADR
jgi:hypothetical protein